MRDVLLGRESGGPKGLALEITLAGAGVYDQEIRVPHIK